ncbi:MAG: hypothetical protein PF541_08005 [Prolixibacteraceae bacterium]|jgi:hypothetical protein|nr:hypothetical protein [Prolixibacteraceae bacterium]
MSTINKIKIAALIIAITLLLSSCLDFNDTKQIAYGDAFIKSVQLTDSNVAYNLELFTYSWSEMEQVEAYRTGNNNTFILDTFDSKYTFKLQTNETSIFEELPESGEYFFDVTFTDGEYSQVADFLTTNYIDPPKISKLEWNESDEKLIVEWEKIDNANLYSVMLLDENKSIVYETELLDASYSSKWITKNTYGWNNSTIPIENKNYTVAVSAYLFEPVVSTFDIQCIAINKLNSFVWKTEEK